MTAKEGREKVLERIMERHAASRRKLVRRSIKVGIALGVIVGVLVVLYPYLQVVWHTRQARVSDPEARKAALQWLADNNVRSATDIFLEALNSTRGEIDIARKALLKFADPSIVPRLLEIWKDTEAKPHGRYKALELVADLGGKEHMDVFIDPLAMLSKGWQSSYDFLNMHADEETVEKLLAMLASGDERQECAAADALRYIRKKSIVKDSDRVKEVLASKLSSPMMKVREGAADALIEIADEKQFEHLLRALDDESPAVCRCAAMAIGYMKPEIALKAVPKLLERLLHEDGDTCTDAANALIKIGSTEAVPRLTEIVKDRKVDSFSRVKAIEVLKATSDPRVLEVITGLLREPDVEVASVAATALIRIGDEKSVGALVDALRAADSQELRVAIAYALGIFGQKEAAPALMEALKEGDTELSKVAGSALIKTGARECAPELASMIRNPEALCEALKELLRKEGAREYSEQELAEIAGGGAFMVRREALLTLSKLRTVSSLEVTIEALTDKEMRIREEARDAAIQLAEDLLGQKKPGLEALRKSLEKTASEMLHEEVGEKLREGVGEAGSFDEINVLVFAVLRRLDRKNKQDHDDLVVALGEAKQAYWTSLLREELTGRGVSEEQIADAAGALKDYVQNTFLPGEPPMTMHRKIGEELKRKFGLQEVEEDEPRRE